MSKMKLQIKRSLFFELISHAHSLIEKRHVAPILSKILIQANKKSLSVQATDQNNSLQSEVPATIKQEGKAVIDAQNLYDILKELPEGDVEIQEQSDKKIKIKQGCSVFHLLNVPVADFPRLPPFSDEKLFFHKKPGLEILN